MLLRQVWSNDAGEGILMEALSRISSELRDDPGHLTSQSLVMREYEFCVLVVQNACIRQCAHQGKQVYYILVVQHWTVTNLPNTAGFRVQGKSGRRWTSSAHVWNMEHVWMQGGNPKCIRRGSVAVLVDEGRPVPLHRNLVLDHWWWVGGWTWGFPKPGLRGFLILPPCILKCSRGKKESRRKYGRM